LEPHPFFQYIKPDETHDDREFVFLIGYIGKVTPDDKVQLYPGLDLGIRYEIPRHGIAYAEKACSVQSTGPSRLVVDASTPITRVRGKNKRSIAAGVLSGAIMEANVWLRRGGHAGTAAAITPQLVNVQGLRTSYSTLPCTHKGHCFCDVPLYDDPTE